MTEYLIEESQESTSEDWELEVLQLERSQEPIKKNKNEEKKKIIDYFTVEPDPKSKKKADKQAICTLCTAKHTVLKMKNCGTSSLRRHMQAKHIKVYHTFYGNTEPEPSTSRTSSKESKNKDASSTIFSWLSNSEKVRLIGH